MESGRCRTRHTTEKGKTLIENILSIPKKRLFIRRRNIFTISPHLLAVDVHVLVVAGALAAPGPGAAVLVEVLAEVAEAARDGAVGQHPGGVAGALRQRGPAGAVPAHRGSGQGEDTSNSKEQHNVRHIPSFIT